MKVREAIYTRRTIRKFRQEPISEDILRELAEAARYAPSGSNLQPLKYKLVGEAGAPRVFPHVHWAGAIAPAGDPKPGEEPAAYIFILVDTNIRAAGYEMDVGIAAQNITLAALEMGIGSKYDGCNRSRGIESRVFDSGPPGTEPCNGAGVSGAKTGSCRDGISGCIPVLVDAGRDFACAEAPAG